MVQTDDLVKRIGQMVVRSCPETTPGAALLLVRNGEVLYRRGIGLANLEHRVPLAPDMPFRLGSITKPVTATAILMLAEAGELALTDPISQLLPDFPMGETAITPEHLLTHTSGIPNYTEFPAWFAVQRQDVSLDQLIDVFRTHPKAFAPGTRWEYSNANYVLLGAIIETISGKTYGEFMADHIFTPLSMADTSYEPTTSRVIPRMAGGYSPGPGAYVHAEYLSYTWLHAAGGLVSTVDDLARWYTALRAGNLLTEETLRKMWTPYLLPDGTSARYGYGWWLGEWQGHRVVEHYGCLPGYAAQLIALPDDDILVIVLSNDEGKLNLTDQLAVATAAMALGKPCRPPAAFPLPAPELRQVAGTYTTGYGMQLAITDEAGQMVLQLSSGERFKLKPYSPQEFFFPEIPASRLVFSRRQNLVTGLTWLPRRGMPVHAQRIS
jgi:CubicO group peptidase (beta-lactamase class C family)